MIHIVDQVGQPLSFIQTPKKIISLVPSLTQTLCDVHLEDSIVGVTKFCVHPKRIRQKASVIGGTKNPRIPEIIRLNPDFIIANKEENRKEDIVELQKHCPVYTSDIATIDDFLGFCDDFSSIFPQSGFNQLKSNVEIINKENTIKNKYRACYLIWKNPYMTVGNDTYIHNLMEKYGFENVFKKKIRYPEITIEDIILSPAEIVFLSSEPYPFKKKDSEELSQYLPGKQVILVDGEMMSWYGSAILNAHTYLKELHIKCGKNKNLNNI